LSDPELVDLHCHLVPGVDDGAPDVDHGLEQLRRFRDLGIRTVVTTPHLAASDTGGRARAAIDEAFARLAAAASEESPDVSLGLSYEIRLDDPDSDLADRDLGLGEGGCLLVEFPMLAMPAYPDRMLTVVTSAGWIPVLAHPERYAGIEVGYGWIGRWREMGALMCANAGSLWGEHGAEAQRVVRRMLSEGAVDLIASDNHARPRRAATVRQAHDFLVDAGWAEQASLLTATNPAAALRGGAVATVPRCELGSAWAGRLRRFVRRA
jgi:protein-tyrosine phosphatase